MHLINSQNTLSFYFNKDYENKNKNFDSFINEFYNNNNNNKLLMNLLKKSIPIFNFEILIKM